MSEEHLKQIEKDVKVLDIPKGEEVPKGAIPVEAIFNLVVAKLDAGKNVCFNSWLSSITEGQRERLRLVIAYTVQYLNLSIKSKGNDFGYILQSCANIIIRLLENTNIHNPDNRVLTQAAISYGLIEKSEELPGLGRSPEELPKQDNPGECTLTLYGFRVVSEREKYPFNSVFKCIIGEDFILKVKLPGDTEFISLGRDDFIMAGKDGGAETNHNPWIIFKGNAKKAPVQSIEFPSRFKVKLYNGREIEIEGQGAWGIAFEDISTPKRF